MSLGMSYKPNLHQNVPGTSVNQAGTVHSQSPSLATLQSYRPVVNDFGPPSLGIPQVEKGDESAVDTPTGLELAGVTAWSESTPKCITNDKPHVGTSGAQVPQSKYAELLAIIEELGKEIRPTYAGSKTAMERLKRGIIHARGLVRECLAETERNARS